MSESPLYRIKISVYDDQTGEELSFVDEPMVSQDGAAEHRADDNLPTYHRAMRKFEADRPDFEKTHYPRPEDDEDEHVAE